MRNSRIVECVSLAVTAAAMLFILVNSWPMPPRPDRHLHQAIGASLAQAALELLAPGGQIVVITRDTDTFRQPALDLLLGSFEKELHRASVKIAAVQKVQLDSLRPVEVPAGDLYERLRRAPPGQVIVSLLGPPLLSEEQWRRLRPLKAKIVAFCPGSTAETLDLAGLFEAGFLHAAIINRSVDPALGSKPHPNAGTFDQLYIKLRAADHSRLPGTSSSSL